MAPRTANGVGGTQNDPIFVDSSDSDDAPARPPTPSQRRKGKSKTKIKKRLGPQRKPGSYAWVGLDSSGASSSDDIIRAIERRTEKNQQRSNLAKSPVNKSASPAVKRSSTSSTASPVRSRGNFDSPSSSQPIASSSSQPVVARKRTRVSSAFHGNAEAGPSRRPAEISSDDDRGHRHKRARRLSQLGHSSANGFNGATELSSPPPAAGILQETSGAGSWSHPIPLGRRPSPPSTPPPPPLSSQPPSSSILSETTGTDSWSHPGQLMAPRRSTPDATPHDRHKQKARKHMGAKRPQRRQSASITPPQPNGPAPDDSLLHSPRAGPSWRTVQQQEREATPEVNDGKVNGSATPVAAAAAAASPPAPQAEQRAISPALVNGANTPPPVAGSSTNDDPFELPALPTDSIPPSPREDARALALAQSPLAVPKAGASRGSAQAPSAAVRDPSPIVAQSSPAVDSSPAVRDSSPAVRDASPAVRDASPAVRDPSPAVRNPSPTTVHDPSPEPAPMSDSLADILSSLHDSLGDSLNDDTALDSDSDIDIENDVDVSEGLPALALPDFRPYLPSAVAGVPDNDAVDLSTQESSRRSEPLFIASDTPEPSPQPPAIAVPEEDVARVHDLVASPPVGMDLDLALQGRSPSVEIITKLHTPFEEGTITAMTTQDWEMEQPIPERRGKAKRGVDMATVDKFQRCLSAIRERPLLHSAIFETFISHATAVDEPTAPEIKIVNEVDFPGGPPEFEFEYSNKMIYHQDVPEPELGKGCECLGPCDPTNMDCSCVRRQQLYFYDTLHTGFAYTDNESVKQNDCPIWECGKTCGCPPSCRNRVIQRGRTSEVKVEIFKTGWGVRTATEIPRGRFVGVYAGELITEAESERRGKMYDAINKTYLFDLDGYQIVKPPDGLEDIDLRAYELAQIVKKRADDDPAYSAYSVDAYHYGFTRFINHSCNPNVVIMQAYVEDYHPERPLLVMFARRDIGAGEELCISYKGIQDDDPWAPMSPEIGPSNLTPYGRQHNKKQMQTTAMHVSPTKSMARKHICYCGERNCNGVMFE